MDSKSDSNSSSESYVSSNLSSSNIEASSVPTETTSWLQQNSSSSNIVTQPSPIVGSGSFADINPSSDNASAKDSLGTIAQENQSSHGPVAFTNRAYTSDLVGFMDKIKDTIMSGTNDREIVQEALENFFKKSLLVEDNIRREDGQHRMTNSSSVVIPETSHTLTSTTLSSSVGTESQISNGNDMPAPPSVTTEVKRGCKCRRSNCFKLYCECFSRGLRCGPHCSCAGCKNCDKNTEDVDKVIHATLVQKPYAFHRMNFGSPEGLEFIKKFLIPLNISLTAASKGIYLENGELSMNSRLASPSAASMVTPVTAAAALIDQAQAQAQSLIHTETHDNQVNSQIYNESEIEIQPQEQRRKREHIHEHDQSAVQTQTQIQRETALSPILSRTTAISSSFYLTPRASLATNNGDSKFPSHIFSIDGTAPTTPLSTASGTASLPYSELTRILLEDRDNSPAPAPPPPVPTRGRPPGSLNRGTKIRTEGGLFGRAPLHANTGMSIATMDSSAGTLSIPSGPEASVLSVNSLVKGCNCKRSGCSKKYCECYLNKLKCTSNCSCVDCKNGNESCAHTQKTESVSVSQGRMTRSMMRRDDEYDYNGPTESPDRMPHELDQDPSNQPWGYDSESTGNGGRLSRSAHDADSTTPRINNVQTQISAPASRNAKASAQARASSLHQTPASGVTSTRKKTLLVSTPRSSAPGSGEIDDGSITSQVQSQVQSRSSSRLGPGILPRSSMSPSGMALAPHEEIDGEGMGLNYNATSNTMGLGMSNMNNMNNMNTMGSGMSNMVMNNLNGMNGNSMSLGMNGMNTMNTMGMNMGMNNMGMNSINNMGMNTHMSMNAMNMNTHMGMNNMNSMKTSQSGNNNFIYNGMNMNGMNSMGNMNNNMNTMGMNTMGSMSTIMNMNSSSNNTSTSNNTTATATPSSAMPQTPMFNLGSSANWLLSSASTSAFGNSSISSSSGPNASLSTPSLSSSLLTFPFPSKTPTSAAFSSPTSTTISTSSSAASTVSKPPRNTLSIPHTLGLFTAQSPNAQKVPSALSGVGIGSMTGDKTLPLGFSSLLAQSSTVGGSGIGSVSSMLTSLIGSPTSALSTSSGSTTTSGSKIHGHTQSQFQSQLNNLGLHSNSLKTPVSNNTLTHNSNNTNTLSLTSNHHLNQALSQTHSTPSSMSSVASALAILSAASSSNNPGSITNTLTSASTQHSNGDSPGSTTLNITPPNSVAQFARSPLVNAGSASKAPFSKAGADIYNTLMGLGSTGGVSSAMGSGLGLSSSISTLHSSSNAMLSNPSSSGTNSLTASLLGSPSSMLLTSAGLKSFLPPTTQPSHSQALQPQSALINSKLSDALHVDSENSPNNHTEESQHIQRGQFSHGGTESIRQDTPRDPTPQSPIAYAAAVTTTALLSSSPFHTQTANYAHYGSGGSKDIQTQSTTNVFSPFPDSMNSTTGIDSVHTSGMPHSALTSLISQQPVMKKARLSSSNELGSLGTSMRASENRTLNDDNTIHGMKEDGDVLNISMPVESIVDSVENTSSGVNTRPMPIPMPIPMPVPNSLSLPVATSLPTSLSSAVMSSANMLPLLNGSNSLTPTAHLTVSANSTNSTNSTTPGNASETGIEMGMTGNEHENIRVYEHGVNSNNNNNNASMDAKPIYGSMFSTFSGVNTENGADERMNSVANDHGKRDRGPDDMFASNGFTTSSSASALFHAVSGQTPPQLYPQSGSGNNDTTSSFPYSMETSRNYPQQQ